jgi:hypothetical protein
MSEDSSFIFMATDVTASRMLLKNINEETKWLMKE